MKHDVVKIGILSDTHYRLSDCVFNSLNGEAKTQQVYDQFELSDKANEILAHNKLSNLLQKKCDLIIHAGDIGDQLIIDNLESIARVVAVNGNCDFYTFKTLNGETKDFELFEFEGVTFALAHRPEDLNSAINGSFLKKPQICAGPDIVDIAIHGHTHLPEVIFEGDEGQSYIQICPGSASQGRYGSPNSIMFLYIVDSAPFLAHLLEV